MKLVHKETPEERRAKVHAQYHEAQQRQFARVRRNVARAWVGFVGAFLASAVVFAIGAYSHDGATAVAGLLLLFLSVAALIALDAWLHRNEDRIS